MVSFWPFHREDASSPKSFEKRLADLSDKIQRLQVRDDTLRATHRRVKVLFTLYSSFIYILVTAILVLVTGYQQWTVREWTGIAGSPVGIFLVRYVLDAYFDWREGNVRTRLEKKIKERDVVIKKLKDAMRYDSTKELLDKYGGSTPRKQRAEAPQAKSRPHSRQSSGNQIQRTGIVPPPTANIPSRDAPQQIVDRRLSGLGPSPIQSAAHSRQASTAVSESFAPNAFEDWQRPVQQSSTTAQPPRTGFLDRMLDLMVGEDESAPRNRIVLLCTSCRMVNGQAPPGVRSLEEIGRWRCTCGAWNGIESEASKVLKEADATQLNKPVPSTSELTFAEADHTQAVDDEEDDAGKHDPDSQPVEEATAANATTRRSARQRQDS